MNKLIKYNVSRINNQYDVNQIAAGLGYSGYDNKHKIKYMDKAAKSGHRVPLRGTNSKIAALSDWFGMRMCNAR